MKLNRSHETLVSRIRKQVPREPGIYLFYDEEGRILYVGKSVNLRDRIRSYFHNHAAEDRIKQMVYNIGDFGFCETGSELFALILEDRLIKNHLPYFNIRQKRFMNYQYLVMTDDPFPALKRVDLPEEGRIFGPFRDRYFVDRILRLIERYFHFRACLDPEPVGKCLNAQIELCSAPCSDGVTESEYSAIVDNVTDFLHGKEELISELLQEDMEESIASMAFEKAAEIKERMRFTRSFCRHQRFIHRFGTRNLVIHENPDLTHLFTKGDYHLHRGRVENISQATDGGEVQNDRYLLDRANIVYTWIEHNQDRCEHYFI